MESQPPDWIHADSAWFRTNFPHGADLFDATGTQHHRVIASNLRTGEILAIETDHNGMVCTINDRVCRRSCFAPPPLRLIAHVFEEGER